MDSPVTFTQQVRPICLPTGDALYSGITGTVIGWGSLREGAYIICLVIPLRERRNRYRIIFVTLCDDTGGHQPDTLQEVNVVIWTNEACRSKYGPSAPGGIVEHFLCAGDNGHDSCSVSYGTDLLCTAHYHTQ